MLPLKWESLSCCSTKLIYVCKNYHLHWIAGRANILYKNLYIYIYIYSIVGVSFVASCNKKNWNNFCIIFAALQFYLYELNECVSLFQTENINIFVLCCFFKGYVYVKSLFSDKTNINGESIKRKFHHWQKLEFWKVVNNAKIASITLKAMFL